MIDVRAGRLLMALTCCFFIAACATSEDETPGDRRSVALEEDNVSLKKQIEDLNAVENALNRELESQKGLAAQEQNGTKVLRDENERLRGAIAKLQADLNQARMEKAKERPVADVKTSGLAGPNIDIIERHDGSVAVRIGGSAMFNTAQDTLTRSGERVLDRIGRFLKQRRDLQVSVEGHTDATPLGKTKAIWGTNLALSLARAMAVQDYLRATQNIAEKRMRVVGYGEHRPLMPGKSKAANAKNRRVEIVLYSKSD